MEDSKNERVVVETTVLTLILSIPNSLNFWT